MSKISCTCGNIISDSSDFISNKAHFIADQDYFDFFDTIEHKDWEEVTDMAFSFFQEIFQCPQCGNILIFRDGQRHDFQPVDPSKSSDILRSYLKEKWRGMIAANYRKERGEIFWHTNLESGFRQGLSLDELKELYFRKFEQLHKHNILRHSFLRINGEITHEFKLDE